jgi:hypothetical protein
VSLPSEYIELKPITIRKMKMDPGSFEKFNQPGSLHSLILDQISALIDIFTGKIRWVKIY